MSSRFYTGFPSSLWLKTSCAYKRCFSAAQERRACGETKRDTAGWDSPEGYGSGLDEPVSRSQNLRANSVEPRRPADRIKNQRTMVGSLGGPDILGGMRGGC